MTTTYCTRQDLEALWPQSALLASVDDDGDGVLSPLEESYVERAIQRASAFLDARLGQRYRLADLAGNRWCRDACAVLAVHGLATRRGGPAPASLQELYDAYLRQLAQIVAGQARVPDVPDPPGNLPAAQRFVVRWDASGPIVRPDGWCV
jgi:phage gp36-like protein